jgi:riboflavin kinase/FMN adenylyltransferase
MKVLTGFESLDPTLFRNPVATIGIFDGMHLGHRAVIDAVRDLARELSGESVAVTFESHPRLVLSGEAPAPITSVPHRLVLLERYGIDRTVLLPFDERVRDTPAGEFCDRVFRDGIGVRGIVLGFDSRFGRGREGDLAFVREWAKDKDVVVRSAPPVLIGGQRISSSAIRKAILAGQHDLAQSMLGRPVAVYGTIVRGDGRGRGLGFPTANVDLGGELCPPDGVYAAWARLAENWMPALVNVGRRPTFTGGEGEVRVEVHVPGLEGDLYGERMEVRFIRSIRGERKFADAAELKARIELDRAELARIIAESGTL